MQRQYIQRDVEIWLKHHPGVTFNRDDIALDIGARRPASISTTLRILAARGHRIEKVSHNTWIYLGHRPIADGSDPAPGPTPDPTPQTKPSMSLFEQIAVSKSGVILARDEDGNLYKVEPFEL